jgi:hypothetical protein
MKKILFVSGLALLALVGYLYSRFFPSAPLHDEDDIHFHAGFVVINDGQNVDFSADRFMHVKSCSLDEHQDPTPEELQIEKVHLHNNIGDVAHIHKPEATWGDLFTNLSYPLPAASFSASLNQEAVTDILSAPIQPYDSLVLIVGLASPSASIYFDNAVTIEHIQDAEAKSETC